MTEILATNEDINAWLPSDESSGNNQIIADDTNTSSIQVGVSRFVKSYLSQGFDASVMATWVDPTTTPDIVREASSLLIASQLYFNQTSASTTEINERHYAQILWDRALLMLQQILSGVLVVPGVDPSSSFIVDFWPQDDTDMAFSKAMTFS